ncbi:acyltransferase family protein [Riemerella anatipestifer]|nr:acyltransferase family protein [Riemerella anatipestifer]
MKYRYEIDGLRALAVIPVILFHLGYSFIKGGYYGVDVFFVISGYLITMILTNHIENNKFSMWQFWLRRVRRLYPTLLIVILSVLLITPFLIFRPVVKDIGRDVFPAIFSYTNFHALFNLGSYWDKRAESSFFLHTWSLSVEEQFYLFYPIFLFLSYRYFRNFVIPLFVLTVVSFALFCFVIKFNNNVDLAFYLLPTRVWELSVGGLSGVLISKYRARTYSIVPNENIKNKISLFASFIGICFIVPIYFYAPRELGLSVVFPIIGSLLLIIFCSPSHVVGKILSSKVFVLVGKLSYSLYLWHWVIISLFRNLQYQLQGINHHFISGLTLILSFLLSFLTYFFIEKRAKTHIHTIKIVFGGICLIFILVLYYRSSLFNDYYHSLYDKQVSYTKFYDISPSQEVLQSYLEKDHFYQGFEILDRNLDVSEAYKKDGIVFSEVKKTPDIMLVGDSHGVMWVKVISDISKKINISLSCYTSNGTQPFINLKDINSQRANEYYTQTQRVEYAKSLTRNIERWKPKVIVFACRWENNTGGLFKKEFNDMLSFLEQRNIKVLLLTQPPLLNFMVDKNAQQFLTYLDINPRKGYNLVNVNNKKVIKANNYLKSLSQKYTNVFIYDVYENMLENNKTKVSLDRKIFYFDDDHLSYYGTTIHKGEITKNIEMILKKSGE